MAAEYSYQMVSLLRRVFLKKSSIIPSFLGNSDTKFGNYNFNQIFLVSPSNQAGDTIELPSLLRNSEWDLNTSLEGCVIPLTVHQIEEKKTAISILRSLFYYSSNYLNELSLRKVITNNAKVYYGAPGLILNSSFEPLLICLSEFDRSSGFVRRHILRISPEVFCNDGIIERHIIKKLIPFYTRNSVEPNCEPVTVEVVNLNKYIARPILPKGNLQENLSNIIRLNKDEIIEGII